MDRNSSGPPQPFERQSRLTDERNRKMAASTHAYVRGSTVKFYEWLDMSDRCRLPEGPAVWICGDCHVGNLGPVASADGKLEVQIRDLDQTVIGNPAHDLVRLGLSLAMAARSSDLPGITTALMLEHLVAGYEAALRAPVTGEDQAGMPKTLKAVMRLAAGRSWKHLADERIEGLEPAIPLGKRFWPLAKDERAAIKDLFKQDDLRRLVTTLRSRDSDATVNVLDAAYWQKGCSSLGRLRYAVLVEIRGERHRETRHCLIDIKEATAAAAPRSEGAAMPRDNAQRVVEGARKLSPFLGDRMVADRLLDRAVVVRELLPQDLKLEIEHLDAHEAMRVAESLSSVVGRAHARQMDEQTRSSWAAELGRCRSANLDVPSWLWSSVVELVGIHEAAYLDHCRRYASAAKAA